MRILFPSSRTSIHICSNRPGDHVLYKNEEQQRAAVVQFVNANERVASIRYIDTGSTDLVSVLELDPHGTSTWATAVPHSHSNSLGVRRGDFVFIHREGSTNGVEKPKVPRIGEVEAWVRETPMTPEGVLTGWRREMAELGTNLATTPGPTDHIIRRPLKEDTSYSWCGEVTKVSPFVMSHFGTTLTQCLFASAAVRRRD